MRSEKINVSKAIKEYLFIYYGTFCVKVLTALLYNIILMNYTYFCLLVNLNDNVTMNDLYHSF